MAYTLKGLGALLVGAAVAQGVDLHFQPELEIAGRVEFVGGAEFVAGVELAGGANFIATHETVVATFDGEEMSGAPEWCKNTSELTWKQRKERMQQHATLQWAKGQVKKLREENESIPDWMEKIVGDDEKDGKMKWAAAEAKRLAAEGTEVPAWMQDLVKENDRWSNRWAACKTAELEAAGEEVPAWMAENGRKGVTEYASEKEANLEEEMEELNEELEEERSVVQADGNITKATEKRLATLKKAYRITPRQQLQELQALLADVDQSEQALQQDGGSQSLLKGAIAQAQRATYMLEEVLEANQHVTRMMKHAKHNSQWSDGGATVQVIAD
jgi:hypothetical protein